MPGSGHEAEDETPDWTARAKGRLGTLLDVMFANYNTCSSGISLSNFGLSEQGRLEAKSRYVACVLYTHILADNS